MPRVVSAAVLVCLICLSNAFGQEPGHWSLSFDKKDNKVAAGFFQLYDQPVRPPFGDCQDDDGISHERIRR